VARAHSARQPRPCAAHSGRNVANVHSEGTGARQRDVREASNRPLLCIVTRWYAPFFSELDEIGRGIIKAQGVTFRSRCSYIGSRCPIRCSFPMPLCGLPISIEGLSWRCIYPSAIGTRRLDFQTHHQRRPATRASSGRHVHVIATAHKGIMVRSVVSVSASDAQGRRMFRSWRLSPSNRDVSSHRDAGLSGVRHESAGRQLDKRDMSDR